MKQHYIPQFYLRGFTDPDTPEGYEPCVWVYPLSKRTWRKRGPGNVAAEAEYYTISTFVALMMVRIPAQHDNLADFMSRLGRLELKFICHYHVKDPQEFEAFKARYRGDLGGSV